MNNISSKAAAVSNVARIWRAVAARGPAAIAAAEVKAGLAREAEYALRCWGHYVRSLLNSEDPDAWNVGSLWRDFREGHAKSYYEYKYTQRTPPGCPEAAVAVWRLTRREPPGFTRDQLAALWAAHVVIGVELSTGEWDRIPLSARLAEIKVEFGITESDYWRLLTEARAIVAMEIARERGVKL